MGTSMAPNKSPLKVDLTSFYDNLRNLEEPINMTYNNSKILTDYIVKEIKKQQYIIERDAK